MSVFRVEAGIIRNPSECLLMTQSGYTIGFERNASFRLPSQPVAATHCLNLRRALEYREYPRIAQNPVDRVFQRKAVAAVDLLRVVGGTPGDAGCEQLDNDTRLEQRTFGSLHTQSQELSAKGAPDKC